MYFGLTVEEALEEFIDLSVKVLDFKGMEAHARSVLLKEHLIKLLENHDVKKEAPLIQPYGECKL